MYIYKWRIHLHIQRTCKWQAAGLPIHPSIHPSIHLFLACNLQDSVCITSHHIASFTQHSIHSSLLNLLAVCVCVCVCESVWHNFKWPLRELVTNKLAYTPQTSKKMSTPRDIVCVSHHQSLKEGARVWERAKQVRAVSTRWARAAEAASTIARERKRKRMAAA